MSDKRLQTATLAGGCFWCLEAVFERLRGVERVVSGYTGGRGAANYDDVCGGRTGHAEAIQVTFDPSEVTFRELIELFFAFHDPTTLNRQGYDAGTQYRSIILFHSPEQEKAAREVIAELTRTQAFDHPIVTELAPLVTFYPAEDYHQGYYQQNPEQPYCRATISPKMAKLREAYAARLREEPAGR